MRQGHLLGLVYRAGGGHNFGGGRSSGSHSGVHSGGFSSGSSSSSGGGAIIGIIVLLLLIGIAVAIILVLRKKGRSMTAYAAAGSGLITAATVAANAPQAPVTVAPTTQDGLTAIRAHDPGFDEARFVSDAEKAFFTVQEAWTQLKPDLSRRVMADSVWQQHRVQIQSYQENHKRNVLENLAIANAAIVGAFTDGAYDTIMLRFRAGCADYDLDTNNNKIIRGNKNFTEWTEDWCFQRSAQATTKTQGGTMASKCPNCGAPLDLDLQGVCKYCRAPVMSGAYDWVLTRIEQVSS
jgi:predicted lipid-binding transport protein (Tim44 family)